MRKIITSGAETGYHLQDVVPKDPKVAEFRLWLDLTGDNNFECISMIEVDDASMELTILDLSRKAIGCILKSGKWDFEWKIDHDTNDIYFQAFEAPQGATGTNDGVPITSGETVSSWPTK